MTPLKKGEQISYEVMAQLLMDLAESYGEAPAYQMLKRVFEEHFVWTEGNKGPNRDKN